MLTQGFLQAVLGTIWDAGYVTQVNLLQAKRPPPHCATQWFALRPEKSVCAPAGEERTGAPVRGGSPCGHQILVVGAEEWKVGPGSFARRKDRSDHPPRATWRESASQVQRSCRCARWVAGH